MKTKKRIISATVWTVCGIAIIGYVMYQWANQGCGIDSLMAALAVYGGACIAFGFISDQWICERNR